MIRSDLVRAAAWKSGRAGGGVIDDALERRRLLGTREFYVSCEDMLRLLRSVFARAPRPVLSLNRLQDGGRGLVHRVEWDGMVFTCVSRRPFVVV
ncbi:MAG: hypothetical protein ACYTGB_03890 [Planctomycetota bacterium]|jgi:hypothetical protein